MNWFSKLDDTQREIDQARLESANRLKEKQLGREQHRNDLLEGENRHIRNLADIESTAAHDSSMALALALRQRNEEIERLQRLVNTLQEDKDFAFAMMDALHQGLVQATGDVAQLLGTDPALVAGRYKLAVIDEMQGCSVIGKLKNDYGPTEYREGATLVDKTKIRMQQSTIYCEELDKGHSASRAAKQVEVITGLPFDAMRNNATGAYTWLDWNPQLLNPEAAQEVVGHYKVLDETLVRAINLKSPGLSAGTPLEVKDAPMAQQADSHYGGLLDQGHRIPKGMHPSYQAAFPNWTRDVRTYQPLAPEAYGEMARKFVVDRKSVV